MIKLLEFPIFFLNYFVCSLLVLSHQTHEGDL